MTMTPALISMTPKKPGPRMSAPVKESPPPAAVAGLVAVVAAVTVMVVWAWTAPLFVATASVWLPGAVNAGMTTVTW